MFGLADNWKPNARLKRLAARLDAVLAEDQRAEAEMAQLDQTRRNGAEELHAICSRFAAELNLLLKQGGVVLDPPEFTGDQFRDAGVTLFQLNARGRIVQIAFEIPPAPVSTETFREPYILQGTVRSFNQESLELHSVEEHELFLCLRGAGSQWRYFDARTYQTGTFTPQYLTALMERLI